MAEVRGGDKLEKALAQMAGKLKRASMLKVGFLAGATYPDGTSVALVAAVQDAGSASRGIPPRPFFRNMVREKSGEWPKVLGDLLKASDMDGRAALAKLGSGIEGQLKQSIVDTNEPPLKAETVKRKGFSKPLIDTAHMIGSVGSEVE